jgi:hypothetical protein
VPRLQPLPPPASVLAAWDVRNLELLAGGQRTTFRSGDVVLKPAGDAREAEWLATTLDGLDPTDSIRIIRPVPARDGRWVIDGWSAWGYLEGIERAGAWRDALEVSSHFHGHVAPIPWSAAIDTAHPWAVGAAFAFGERELEIPERFSAVVNRLLDLREPLDLPKQLIHSDLCNNILFHPALPPAVIDISVQWRPKPFADAIAVVDAIGWFGAGPDAVTTLHDDIGTQLAVRAALFRLGSATILFNGHDDRLGAEIAVYESIINAISA